MEFPADTRLSGFTGRWPELATIRAEQIPAERTRTFRYCICGGTYENSGSSGLAWTPGDELFFAYGAWTKWNVTPSVVQEAGTLMHEFGHNLGLGHGGLGAQMNVNYKPNYVSIMNYLYQMSGLYRGGAEGIVDYSNGTISGLNESTLSESAGLDPGAAASQFRVKWQSNPSVQPTLSAGTADINLDFNNNNTIDPGTYATRLADMGAGTPSIIHDHNDWGGLDLRGGGHIRPAGAPVSGTGTGGGATVPTPPWLPREAALEVLMQAAAEVKAVAAEAPRAVAAQTGTPVPVRISISNPHDEARSYALTPQLDPGVTVTGLPSTVTVEPRMTLSLTVQATVAGDGNGASAGAPVPAPRPQAAPTHLLQVAVSDQRGDLHNKTRVVVNLVTDARLLPPGTTQSLDGSAAATAHTPTARDTRPYAPPAWGRTGTSRPAPRTPAPGEVTP